MQATQKQADDNGMVWLSINSTEAGHGDYLTPAKLKEWMQGHATPKNITLMDETGTVGRSYGARTTPHIFIIGSNGDIVYTGAIDSIPTPSKDDVNKAINHVKQAMTELATGKPVSLPSTRPYGCWIKSKN